MPSPIAHLAAGYLVYRVSAGISPSAGRHRIGPLPLLPAAVAGFSLLPDVDAVAGLLSGNFGRYHNNLTHSLLVGLAVALAGGALMSRRNQPFRFWFGVALTAFALHSVMDAATPGRGVMLAWPLTPDRMSLPWALFYGFHWSDGWYSSRHLWTAMSESAFAGLVWLLGRRLRPEPATGADSRHQMVS